MEGLCISNNLKDVAEPDGRYNHQSFSDIGSNKVHKDVFSKCIGFNLYKMHLLFFF